MEPNKLEKQFREQLNSREIKPSEIAWDKLDAMLNVAEKKPKRNFKWIYAAATVLGFLLVSTVYFNRFETLKINKNTPIVLEEKSDLDNLEKPKRINEVSNNQIKEKPLKQQNIICIGNTNLSNLPKQVNSIEEEVLLINKSKENVVTVNSSEKENDQSIRRNRYISAEKLLAEVSNTKYETKATEKTFEKTRNAISVNPNDLLLNAETELNQSFRESALDRFNKNFKVVKTVIANRNYEE